MKSNICQLCGRQLHYRIENRAGHHCIIWSIRGDYDGTSTVSGKILVEGKARRLSKQFKSYLQAYNKPAQDESGDLTQDFLSFSARQFLLEVLDITKAEGRARCSSLSQTLGTAALAFYSRLLHREGRSVATVRDDTRILDALIQRLGHLPVLEVSPQACAANLAALSDHQRKGCVRLLRALFDLMITERMAENNPWDKFQFSDKPNTPSYSTLVSKNLEAQVLTKGQCGELLSQLPAVPTGSHNEGVQLALFLVLVEHLSLEEICGLNVGDLSFLLDFKSRMAIHVRREFRKAEKNYLTTDIVDPYQRRVLPLPHLLTPLCQALILGKPKDAPLISRPGYKHRRISPEQLRREIESILSPVQQKKVTPVKGSKPASGLQLLLNTSHQKLPQYGYEDEELRYQEGRRPILTSAKSYCDFANEAQLNKMGAIQDRWLGSCVPPHCTMSPKNICRRLPAKGKMMVFSGSPGTCLNIDLTLCTNNIDPVLIPEEGIILEISADYGASGKAWCNIKED